MCKVQTLSGSYSVTPYSLTVLSCQLILLMQIHYTLHLSGHFLIMQLSLIIHEHEYTLKVIEKKKLSFILQLTFFINQRDLLRLLGCKSKI